MPLHNTAGRTTHPNATKIINYENNSIFIQYKLYVKNHFYNLVRDKNKKKFNKTQLRKFKRDLTNDLENGIYFYKRGHKTF